LIIQIPPFPRKWQILPGKYMQVNTDQYRETKRRLQKESRKAYWQYLENIICYDESIETVQKQKKFWNYIGNTKKDSSGVAPL
jgi:hypothetical protein